MTFWPTMMHHHTMFGYKRFSSWGDISWWSFTKILNLSCDLDLDNNRAIQTFHKTIQFIMKCHQTKFSCKRVSISEDILESHILIIWSFTVTLTLKTADQSFWETIWLMVRHQNTMFVSKRLSDPEDTVWTNTDVLKFCCDLDLEHSNPISSQDILAFDNVLSNQIW